MSAAVLASKICTAACFTVASRRFVHLCTRVLLLVLCTCANIAVMIALFLIVRRVCILAWVVLLFALCMLAAVALVTALLRSLRLIAGQARSRQLQRQLQTWQYTRLHNSRPPVVLFCSHVVLLSSFALTFFCCPLV